MAVDFAGTSHFYKAFPANVLLQHKSSGYTVIGWVKQNRVDYRMGAYGSTKTDYTQFYCWQYQNGLLYLLNSPRSDGLSISLDTAADVWYLTAISSAGDGILKGRIVEKNAASLSLSDFIDASASSKDQITVADLFLGGSADYPDLDGAIGPWALIQGAELSDADLIDIANGNAAMSDFAPALYYAMDDTAAALNLGSLGSGYDLAMTGTGATVIADPVTPAGGGLVAADVSLDLSASSADLVAESTLSAAYTTLNLTAEQGSVVSQSALSPANNVLQLSAERATLVAQQRLSAADSTLALSAEAADLTAHSALVAQDCMLTLTADPAALSAQTMLSASEAVLNLSAAAASLGFAAALSPAGAMLALSSENAALTAQALLAARDAVLELQAERAGLSTSGSLDAGDAVLELQAESAQLLIDAILAAHAALLDLTSESADLISSTTLQAQNVELLMTAQRGQVIVGTFSIHPDRVLMIDKEQRVLQIDRETRVLTIH